MELHKEVVRARADSAVTHNYAALRALYLAANDNILDSDRAKELFPEFSANLQSRRIYSSAMYPAAARFIDRLLQELLSEPLHRDKQKLICFTAGSPGSGKSSVVNVARDVFSSAALVLDGTLSDQARARRQIDQSLAAGYEVQIFFVYRPLEDCLRGVWERAMSDQNARATPFQIVIDKHNGALATVKELRRHHQTKMFVFGPAQPSKIRPSISFWSHRFVQLGEPMLPVSWEEIDQAPIYDLVTARKMAYAVLDESERSTTPVLRVEAESLRRILAEGLG